MNPFVYGEEVSGENFCNRKSELREILNDIKNGQNLMLFSPKRYGKTSLIKEVLRQAEKEGIITVYVDLYPVLTEEDFIVFSLKAITNSIKGSITTKLKRIKFFFNKLSPKISMELGENGIPSFSFGIDKQDILPAVEDVFNGFQKYLYSKSKQGVIVFDEFQQISLFQTDQLEKKLRSHIQSHRNISYIFMGSKKHLIYDIFNNPHRPFYRSTKHFPLEKIDDKEMAFFIREKFFLSNREISQKIVEEVLKITESHPYYTQFLCNVLWDYTLEKKKFNYLILLLV